MLHFTTICDTRYTLRDGSTCHSRTRQQDGRRPLKCTNPVDFHLVPNGKISLTRQGDILHFLKRLFFQGNWISSYFSLILKFLNSHPFYPQFLFDPPLLYQSISIIFPSSIIKFSFNLTILLFFYLFLILLAIYFDISNLFTR